MAFNVVSNNLHVLIFCKSMQGFLRLFPLNCVIFPEEVIHLHIFEPRYLQMMGECENESADFGIPFYDSELQSFGTRMNLMSIQKRYSDGKLDIKAIGMDTFELLKFTPKVEGHLYPGGTIKTLPLNFSFDVKRRSHLVDLLDRFFVLLDVKPKNEYSQSEDLSFRIGHQIGLSMNQEYDLLLLADESDRQEFLISHLEDLIPILEIAESAKSRIKMNGFFRSFKPLDF